jgi:hypothetical protein
VQRVVTNVPSQETGQLLGQDTDCTELSVSKEDEATMHRASRSEVVVTQNIERTGSNGNEKFRSNILDAIDKSNTVKNKLSGVWNNIKSKFPEGYQKHVVIISGIVICTVCCLRFVL